MTLSLLLLFLLNVLIALALWLAEPVEHQPRHAAGGGS